MRPKTDLVMTYSHHPFLEHKLTLMRDRLCSTDRYRRLMKELGMFLAYELTRDLELDDKLIEVPSGNGDGQYISYVGRVLRDKKIGIVPILRGGLSLAEGVLELIPSAKVGHIGLQRSSSDYGEVIDYFTSIPDPVDRSFFILDAVIGTGTVASHAIGILRGFGVPETKIKLGAILASQEGLHRVREQHRGVAIYTISIEPGLDDRKHIAPGFGDAANRQFGTN